MGHFIDFYLPYVDENGKKVSSDTQALAIITAAKKLIKEGAKGVAITYSANFGQTELIHKTYRSAGWKTQTSGSNQADVMRAMESLLGGKYSALQKYLQIAPITTMTYSNYGGKTHKAVVDSDLAYIRSLLDSGWDVLGWQNQDSKPNHAIGGGVSEMRLPGEKPQFPIELKARVMSTLAEFALEYPKDLVTETLVASTKLPTPKPGKVWIKGSPFELVAFYYPGYNEPWDDKYVSNFLSNFYPCSFSLTINGITGAFQNAEAAFQATKWWESDANRTRFETAKSGGEAFRTKNELRDSVDYSYCNLGRNGAMMAVIEAKFNLPEFKTGLLATGEAYLLEHNPKKGRDTYWSDDNDGSGSNMLGTTLMEVRRQLGGSGVPAGNYSVSDFTEKVGKVAASAIVG